MRLDFIEAKNFFNHQHTKIDLRDYGSPLLIKGENGAGKSSLFSEALIFAIFGETRLPSLDDCIRNGAQDMGVGIQFNLNGQNVEILRTKKRGRSAKLELIIDGVQAEELLTETQKRINKMFGLSYNSFLSSIILKQEDSDFFVKQKPDERKKIIGEILDLNAYERLEKIAREERSNLKSDIKIEEAAYNNVTVKDSAEIAAKIEVLSNGLAKVKGAIEVKETELNDNFTWNATMTEQVRNRDEVMVANDRVTAMMEDLRRRIGEATVELNNLKFVAENGQDNHGIILKADAMIDSEQAQGELLQAQIVKLQNAFTENTQSQIEERNNDLLVPQRALDTINFEISSLQNRLEKAHAFKEITCPTCLQTVDELERAKVILEMEDKLSSLTKDRLTYEAPIEDIIGSIKMLRTGNIPWQEQMTSSIDASKERLQDIITNVRSKRQQLKEIQEVQRQYELAKQKVDMLMKGIGDQEQILITLGQQIREVPEVTMETKPTDELRATIQTYKTQYDMAVRAMSTLENELEQNNIAVARKNELEALLRDKIHRIGLMEKLCVAFSRKGIPAAIIETVLPEIEAIANNFLNRMSQGRLQIMFKTTETQKNGVEKDTLEIEVFDGQEWRRFESFSGGEQFRISLSIRLALSKVLARRANIDLQLLVLDEAATSLDGPGREEFVSTVLSLRNDFERIILMSHIPELADNFDNQINLYRSNEGTRIAKS